jgi:outer membrane lipoprotein SlyB
MKLPALLLPLLLGLSLTGCANVDQIDRGTLSKKFMQIDPHPQESVFRNEVRSFRESAIGGSSAVGGGCGCN